MRGIIDIRYSDSPSRLSYRRRAALTAAGMELPVSSRAMTFPWVSQLEGHCCARISQQTLKTREAERLDRLEKLFASSRFPAFCNSVQLLA